MKEQDAQQEMQMQMMSVVHRMREIPELESEKPKDVSILHSVEFPEEGGVLTYMQNHDYPYRGFPFFEMVEKIDLIKKVVRSSFSSFFHSTKVRPKLQLALVVFVPWLVNDAIKATIYTFYRIVERFRIKREMYSQSMRELHRAFSVSDNELASQIRDLACMVLEFDNAYRFRFQDVIVEIDKQALKKKPASELRRLLTIMQSREKEQTVKDTWTLFKWGIPIFLFLNRNVKRQVVAILTELNLDEVALTTEDKWYCHPRKDYTFGFQLNPTKEDAKLIERINANRAQEEERIQIREKSDNEHQKLFARQNAEMKMDAETDKKISEELSRVEMEIHQKAGTELEERKKEIFKKHLSRDKYALLQKHDREIREMNDYYEQKLNAI